MWLFLWKSGASCTSTRSAFLRRIEVFSGDDVSDRGREFYFVDVSNRKKQADEIQRGAQSCNSLIVEIDYELKREAVRGHSLPGSDEEWLLHEKDRNTKVIIAQLWTAPPITWETRPLYFGQAQHFPTTR